MFFYMANKSKEMQLENKKNQIQEIEDFAGFVQEESSPAGKLLSDLIYSFTNDFEFGTGAQIGVSTQKFHIQ